VSRSKSCYAHLDLTGGGVMRDTAMVPSDDERAEMVRRSKAQPAVHPPVVDSVFHYSEDGTIRRFAPHVPPSNPRQPPSVWAIDELHAPLYWFPRRCPRISVWAYDDDQQRVLTEEFDTEASRIVAAESDWFDRVRSARVYRYRFDASEFVPWSEADGQYISTEVVHPVEVEPLDDLLLLHAAAGIEYRSTPRLGRLMDHMLSSGLPFSFVRIRDARR